MQYQTTGKRHLQKIKQSKSILFQTSSYKRQLNTFCWKAIRKSFNWYHFNITQLHQLQKSILRVCFEIWLCSGNIFILYHILTTIDSSKLQCFGYNILYHTLYFTKSFFICKRNTSLCSLCNFEDEVVINFFVHSSKTKRLWCTVTESF